MCASEVDALRFGRPLMLQRHSTDDNVDDDDEKPDLSVVGSSQIRSAPISHDKFHLFEAAR